MVVRNFNWIASLIVPHDLPLLSSDRRFALIPQILLT